MRTFSDRARSLYLRQRRTTHSPLHWIWKQITFKRLAFAGIGIPLAAYLLWDASRHVIVLDPIVVPKQLADAGLTSEVVTQRVREKLEEIRAIDEAQSQRDQVSTRVDSDIPDIEIPETKLSLQAVSDVLRKILHNEPKHLSGEITYPIGKTKGEVRCRLLEAGELVQAEGERSVDIANSNEAVELMARELTELGDPYLLGIYLLAKKDFASASQLSERMLYSRLDIDHMYAKAHMLRSEIAAAKDKPDEAVNEAKTATKFSPTWLSPYIVLGYALEARHDLDEAAKQFRWIIEQEEAAPSYRYRWAIRLNPYYSYPHQGLGNVLYDQHNLDGAAAEYRRAIQVDPSYSYPHLGLGNVLDDQHDRDEAIKEYRRAIQLDPSYDTPHTNLGRLLDEQNKYDEAVTEFRRSIQLDPTDPDPHTYLGDVLNEQDKPEEAVKEYRKAIQLDPTNATSYTDLGNLLDKQHKPEEAVIEYRKAIQLDPSGDDPHTDLADVLREQHKLDESAAECRKAMKLDPSDADPHTNLGNVFMDQHKLVEAAAEYRTASHLDPTDAEPHHSLGLVLKAQGKPDQAAVEFDAAHKLDPSKY